MYCARCGDQQVEGSRFCKNCGAPLDAAAGPPPAAAAAATAGRGAVILMLGILVLVFHLDLSHANLFSALMVLVVGSFLRKDHPLIAQRLRQAAKKGTEVSLLHSVTDAVGVGTEALGRLPGWIAFVASSSKGLKVPLGLVPIWRPLTQTVAR